MSGDTEGLKFALMHSLDFFHKTILEFMKLDNIADIHDQRIRIEKKYFDSHNNSYSMAVDCEHKLFDALY
jgi:hypothetical protein